MSQSSQPLSSLAFHYMRSYHVCSCNSCALPSPLYSKLRTSPLDTGPEQGYTCSMKLLNWPRKVSLLHPARPIEKARTSSASFLSPTDHERVALRAPQYKGT